MAEPHLPPRTGLAQQIAAELDNAEPSNTGMTVMLNYLSRVAVVYSVVYCVLC